MYKLKPKSRPPPPFSVHIQDARLSTLPMVLSAVRIPIQWSQPTHQRLSAVFRFNVQLRSLKRRHRNKHSYTSVPWFLRFLLLPCLLFTNYGPTTYAIQGTNYAITSGAPSLDNTRQHAYIQTILSQFRSHSESSSDSLSAGDFTSRPTLAPTLRITPLSFIADTDSTEYILDTGANRFIINDARLFVKLTSRKSQVKGINGADTPALGHGIIDLPMISDSQQVSLLRGVPAVYVPSSPYNLLPPQLLVREMKQHGFRVRYSEQNDVEYIFNYNPNPQSSSSFHRLTVPLGHNDLYKFRSAPGYCNFLKCAKFYPNTTPAFKHPVALSSPFSDPYCSPVGQTREFSVVAPSCNCQCQHISPTAFPTISKTREPTKALSQDKTRELLKHKTVELEDLMEDMDSNPKPTATSTPQVIPFQDSDFNPIKTKPVASKFDSGSISLPTQDADVLAMQRKKTRLLMYHEKLGHLSFSILRLMARAGIIPRDLASVDPPTCPGCAYGKAHRLKWRHKGFKNRKKIKIATAPGQVVSMDQLISPTPGFVPTHRGTPTKQRYVGATVFVDHFSDFTYVHLMTEMNSEATVEAKKAFERLAKSYQISIKHYHGDNGLFDTKLFWSSIKASNQTMSFCGVNAHHQNGKAERRIRDITENARTSLLHAAHRWPKAIHPSLWPAALKNYVNLRNTIPTRFVKGSKRSEDTFIDSPLSKFSGTEMPFNFEHFHPFGSPVYILEDKLQALQSHNKWSDRSKVGIFMTHSPSHSSNVPLVLNTRTAHVTPQFHCLYDDEFATCKRDPKFQSLWQYKAKVLNDSNKNMNQTTSLKNQIPSLQPLHHPLPLPSSLPSNFIQP